MHLPEVRNNFEFNTYNTKVPTIMHCDGMIKIRPATFELYQISLVGRPLIHD